jgi:RNA polymerase sigma factor (sigma-70 family)
VNAPATSAGTLAPDDLVIRIANGDRSAEIEFARNYTYGITVLARRHCRSSEQAVADLVQDVIECVLQKLRAGAVRHTASLPAYVQSCIARAASGEFRRRNRRGEDQIVPLDEELRDSSDPSDEFEIAQRAGIVRTLLAELDTARDRAILRRFYIDEEGKDSICLSLGIGPEHFHRVLFRARRRLRELLTDAGLAPESRPAAAEVRQSRLSRLFY